jgi:hypothetical protein
VVKESWGSTGAKADPPDRLTEEDLLQGKKACKFLGVLCVIAFVACVGIAVFVFTNVPWNTRMPYDGKFNRSGTGIPMQIAMLAGLVLLFGLWHAARKPDAHHMRKGSRVGAYIFGTAIILACAIAQWVMASEILRAGGYLTG